MCRCTHNDICRLSGCRVRRKDIFIVMITLCGDQQLNPNIQSGGEYKWPGVAAGCAVPLSRGRHGYLLHQQSYHDTIYTASYSPILNSHKVNIKDFWSHLPWRPVNLKMSLQRQFHFSPALFTCLMKNWGVP